MTIDELEALANAASPGPWRVSRYHDDTVLADRDENPDHGSVVADTYGTWGIPDFSAADNARFIAASRTAVPELIARVRKLETLREAVVKYVAESRRHPLNPLAGAISRDAIAAALAETEVVGRDHEP